MEKLTEFPLTCILFIARLLLQTNKHTKEQAMAKTQEQAVTGAAAIYAHWLATQAVEVHEEAA